MLRDDQEVSFIFIAVIDQFLLTIALSIELFATHLGQQGKPALHQHDAAINSGLRFHRPGHRHNRSSSDSILAYA